MADPLPSVQDRLDRAQEHFEEVNTRLRAYYAADPYVIEGETEFQGDNPTERILYVEPPEERFSTVLGEMLHDLRSALDHLAQTFVTIDGGDPTESAFPVRRRPPPMNAKEVRPELLGGCKSDDVLRFLDEVQPYQLGGTYYLDGLWILHRLAIIDRHRHIVPRHITLANPSWRFHGIPPTQAEWHAHTIRSDENGAELELRIDQPNANVEGTTTLKVMVDERSTGDLGPDPVPLLDLLHDANNKCCDIVRKARDAFF